MSQRDFNNNTGNLTDIYNSQNATNLVVRSLPTKSDCNAVARMKCSNHSRQ